MGGGDCSYITEADICEPSDIDTHSNHHDIDTGVVEWKPVIRRRRWNRRDIGLVGADTGDKKTININNIQGDWEVIPCTLDNPWSGPRL